MLKESAPQQYQLEMVTLEGLVSQHHLVRKIDAAIDFEFIRDEVVHLYCHDNGRPAIDPVVLFKMMLPGYLVGGRVLYTDSTHLKASATPRKAVLCTGITSRKASSSSTTAQ